MGINGQLLNAKETQLIQLLTSGMTIADAAKAMDIDHKTASRWLKRPHVEAAYKEVTKDMASLVRKQIEGLSSRAIAALEESLDSPSHLAKIQAIKIVLDRLDPETLKVAQPVQQADAGQSLIDPALLSYINEDEMGLIESIIERARTRKEEAESKVTPMRKTG